VCATVSRNLRSSGALRRSTAALSPPSEDPLLLGRTGVNTADFKRWAQAQALITVETRDDDDDDDEDDDDDDDDDDGDEDDEEEEEDDDDDSDADEDDAKESGSAAPVSNGGSQEKAFAYAQVLVRVRNVPLKPLREHLFAEQSQAAPLVEEQTTTKSKATTAAAPSAGVKKTARRASAPVVAPIAAPIAAAAPIVAQSPAISRAPSKPAAATTKPAKRKAASADPESIDVETVEEGRDWMERDTKRAEAVEKPFEEFAAEALAQTSSPKKARTAKAAADAKPVRAAKVVAAEAMQAQVRPKVAAKKEALEDGELTDADVKAALAKTSKAGVPAALTAAAESTDSFKAPPSRAKRGIAEVSTSDAAATTTAAVTTTTIAIATTTEKKTGAAAKKERDAKLKSATTMKHNGDSILKGLGDDPEDAQDRRDAYDLYLSAGLLWIECATLSSEPHAMLSSTHEYLRGTLKGMSESLLPLHRALFLRCRAMVIVHMSRLHVLSRARDLSATVKKQYDSAQRELMTFAGNDTNELCKKGGSLDKILQLHANLCDARDFWTRASQIWRDAGREPVAWPCDGDFTTMALEDFVSFVRLNRGTLLTRGAASDSTATTLKK
jgi:hypothetical protein